MVSNSGNVSFPIISYVWGNWVSCFYWNDKCIYHYKIQHQTIYGEEVEFHPKKFNKGNIIGGLLFGFGWAITGACPGPLFAQIGSGATVIVITLLSAILGTWTYGLVRDKLPH